MSSPALPPLSLYIHIPWCIKKCPYCDFNSHTAPQALPETEYVAALQRELRNAVELAAGRPLHSIFFGGGTPSLFSARAIEEILITAEQTLGFTDNIEITLEANPGAAEQRRFHGYRAAGVNRLSIGVQSFSAAQLDQLGRVHSADEAHLAIGNAQKAGFERINVDLMHGLPGQTPELAMEDLQRALESGADHLSWYQLTLEPNTAFYSKPPTLPGEETLDEIALSGHQRLLEAGFEQYEVSAYQSAGGARHNLNYWEFGDYLAVGAGAHAKITTISDGNWQVIRSHNSRRPEDYLQRNNPCAGSKIIGHNELPLEFMLNALRLRHGVSAQLFEARTGLPLESIATPLARLRREGLLEPGVERLQTTALGYRFLNSVVAAFDSE